MFGYTCKIGRALLVARAVVISGRHSKRFYPAKKKRFYKEVSIVRSGDQFEVCLDQRKLKTPLGKLLLVPNEALAVAVATEWDCQQTEINPNEMHLTGLCNTVVDNPSKKTKEDTASDILEFLESDTLCYRMQEPDELVTLQKEKWDPLLRWYEERFNVKLEAKSDLAVSTLPQEVCDVAFKHLMSYSLWGLTGIQYGAESLKSLILFQAALAQHLSVEQAVMLGRLESEFQTSRWGRVEWAHDLDREQVLSRVAAAVLFVQLTSESSSIVSKSSAAKPAHQSSAGSER
ncbi:ATP synthase mitochondrial F1 complex assembly factor 2 [Dermacentor andersoni]|uniref:ATP synthase mitochondrial F1 complex assembly factor 2 n=1 Tax=Dermacentor andersoni TaxID=34620 RepID=UPI002155C383|nr:ATP synthase mitochondrial F1 complex assembly factor 2-like [Dermacentor andersoni]